MRLTEPIEEYEYFCIMCSKMKTFRLRAEEPPAFIEGEECSNCNHSQWAYSPPANEFKSDL